MSIVTLDFESYYAELVKVFHNLGIQNVFTIPGSLMYLLDFIDRTASFAIFSSTHEDILGYMAIGSYHSTSSIPILLLTKGPGVTNAVSPICCSYRDRVPLIVLTSYSKSAGYPILQQSTGDYLSPCITDLLKPVTDFQLRISSLDDSSLDRVAKIISNLRGPCLIEVPEDEHEYSISDNVTYPVNGVRHNVDLGDLTISSGDAVILGAGVPRNASSNIISLAQEKEAFVTTTLRGIDRVPSNTYRYLGPLGVYGSVEANKYLARKAERIVSLGASLNNMTTSPWLRSSISREAELHYVSITPPPEFATSCANIDLELLPKSDGNVRCVQRERNKNAIMNAINTLDAVKVISLESFNSAIVNGINIANGDIVLCSPSHAPLGCSLPLAIGSACINRDTPHFVICGDGGFLFTGMSLLTAKKYKAWVFVLVLVNNEYGRVADAQRKRLGHTIATDLCLPELDTLAASMGINSVEVKNGGEMSDAILMYQLSREPLLAWCDAELLQ